MSASAASAARFSVLSAARKYSTVFSVCLAERFAYRTDFFVTTLLRFLPVVTITFLWTSIFAASDSERIAGFTRDEIVAYNLLVFVSRAFSSMPGLAVGVAADIRDGAIKKYLTQPVDMIGFLATMRVAHKVVYYTTAIAPYSLVLFLCRGYFGGWPRADVLGWYALALVCAFLIGFLFETWIGLLGFWTLEVTSLSYIAMSFVFVLSGHMFPLDLLPAPLAQAVQWLPFQYLAYFPAKLFLHGGALSPRQLGFELTRMLANVALLLVLVRWTYAAGLRRYSAFGG